jgi:hypothetical protein
LLMKLPADHPKRARIMDGYQKMMAGLLKYQGPNRTFCQGSERFGLIFRNGSDLKPRSSSRRTNSGQAVVALRRRVWLPGFYFAAGL